MKLLLCAFIEQLKEGGARRAKPPLFGGLEVKEAAPPSEGEWGTASSIWKFCKILHFPSTKLVQKHLFLKTCMSD